jgi:hypothetical protein
MRTIARRFSLLVSALLSVAGAAHADDKINTDRPDFVNSSVVVGRGVWQVETSLAGERTAQDGTVEHTHSTPTMLRYGLTDTFELQVSSDGRMSQAAGPDTVRGYGDLGLGAKWHLADGGAGAPGLGVIVHADLDTGSPAFRGQGVRPAVFLAAEWDLPADSSIGIMPGVVFDKRDDGGRFTSAVFAVSVGRDWNDRLHSFVELAAPTITAARNGGTTASVDAGASYLLSDRVQVDAALFRGLNRRTADLAWTLGLSARF